MGELFGDGNNRTVDRRGFLKGSALLAAAVAGVAVAAPAFAQEPGKSDQKKPDEKDESAKTEEKKPAEPAGDQARKEAPPAKTGEQAKNDPNKLFDKDGREYRVCDRCGGNMYKEGTTWTCEQCGFSYVE